MREQELVGRYYSLAPKKRLNYILKHYSVFPAVIKDYEQILQKWIENEVEMARQEAHGDLGVRIQGRTGGSRVEETVCNKDELERIVKNRSMGGLLRHLKEKDSICRGLKELSLMEYEFYRLKIKISTLQGDDEVIFCGYITKKMTAGEIGEKYKMTVRSVRNRISRIKAALYENFECFLGYYNDENILRFRELGEAYDEQ